VDGAATWQGTTWTATRAQRAAVDAVLDVAARWSRRTGVALYLGEFGAYHRAPEASRVSWTRHVRAAAERRGMSWSYWELAAGFRVYDRELRVWDQPLLRALVPSSPSLAG
jgi:endoglucanase